MELDLTERELTFALDLGIADVQRDRYRLLEPALGLVVIGNLRLDLSEV